MTSLSKKAFNWGFAYSCRGLGHDDCDGELGGWRQPGLWSR